MIGTVSCFNVHLRKKLFFFLLHSNKLLKLASISLNRSQRQMHSNPHMHTKKVRVRFKKMMHSSYRLFLSFTHIRNKRNCLSVNNTQLFGNCLWQLYEKNKTKLCDKERRVSGKHREVSQPTRLLIHTCERHPVLPGVQHQNRTIKFFPSLPSVEGLPSNSTPPIRDSMLH